MKRNMYQELIEQRISDMPYGTVIISNDFKDIASLKTINKALERINKSGKIRKIIRGIYDKPLYSNVLKEYAAINVENVVNTLKRKYNWIISPSGNTALNYLHLDTQVSNAYSFVSSGPNKEYIINGYIIKFKNIMSREIIGLSYKTIILIQALKEIGKDNITSEHINILKNEFNDIEKNTILNESRNVSAWIYEIIKVICEE